MGKKLKVICDDLGAQFIFKASYDKANRTSVDSFRGLPVREGCEILASVGADLGVPVTTDVHSAEEVAIAAEFIDVLQIPAFLCRQTDLIRAAAETGRVVNVKKGQFLAPWDVKTSEKNSPASAASGFFSPSAASALAIIILSPTCARCIG
jgi:2-dehydro-3-deoxyphosphooctonate aldolase (KDO 8-P synthase)